MAMPEIDNIIAHRTKYRCICRIPGCGYFIARGPLEIPKIGEAPTPAMVALVEKLAQHVMIDHPAEHMRLSQSIQTFVGMLTLMLFTLEDPRLIQEYHFYRSTFHKLTERYNSTDAQIHERLAHLEVEADSELEEDLYQLIRDLRDFLTEQGRYAPDTSDQPLVKL